MAAPYWILVICAKYFNKYLKDLKLEEVSSLSVSYNITISWLYPLNGV